MRVALLSYECADYSIQLANGLASHCDVLLMLSRASLAEHPASLHPAVRLHPFDKPRLRQPFRQLRTAASLVRQIRRFRPNVVHLQHGQMWFNLALPLLRPFPLVVTIHDPRQHVGDRASRRTPQWMANLAYRWADQVVVHGESLKQELIRVMGAASDRIHVIPHVAIGNPDAPGEISDDNKSVLFFGRIWDYKGLKYLIEAEPLIRRSAPNSRIVIAGEGDDFEPYRRLMVQPDRFEVHNRFITSNQRDELFRRAAVVTLPYIEATQSGVIPVAYSFAKPVVATRVGALAEAVDDGVTGLLVPPGDSIALATAIAQLLQDPARRRAMGVAGRQKLDAEWSPQVVAQKSMEVYRRAITDRRGSSKTAAAHDRLALEMHESHV